METDEEKECDGKEGFVLQLLTRVLSVGWLMLCDLPLRPEKISYISYFFYFAQHKGDSVCHLQHSLPFYCPSTIVSRMLEGTSLTSLFSMILSMNWSSHLLCVVILSPSSVSSLPQVCYSLGEEVFFLFQFSVSFNKHYLVLWLQVLVNNISALSFSMAFMIL